MQLSASFTKILCHMIQEALSLKLSLCPNRCFSIFKEVQWKERYKKTKCCISTTSKVINVMTSHHYPGPSSATPSRKRGTTCAHGSVTQTFCCC